MVNVSTTWNLLLVEGVVMVGLPGAGPRPVTWKLRVATSRRVSAGVAVGAAAGLAVVYIGQASPFLYFRF